MKKVLLGIVILGIVFVGGCFAVVGFAANEVDKAIKAEEKNDVPSDVVVGKAFTHDDFAVKPGWKIAKEFGSATIEGLKVTNRADTARSALFTFTFVRGGENLAEVECSSNDLQPGQSSKMDCISFDGEFPKNYKKVQVADMW